MTRDRKHQPLLKGIGPNPVGAIRPSVAPSERIPPLKSPLRNRPQAQKPPRACLQTVPAPPVANPAPGNPDLAPVSRTTW